MGVTWEDLAEGTKAEQLGVTLLDEAAFRKLLEEGPD